MANGLRADFEKAMSHMTDGFHKVMGVLQRLPRDDWFYEEADGKVNEIEGSMLELQRLFKYNLGKRGE